MTTINNKQPRPMAFVIMPFSAALDDVYEDVWKPTLLECELDVSRADDLGSHQNIVGDIVQGISSANIILADLTRLDGNVNGNVFYELGIAHALNKPVILIAQNIGHIPFDLRAYRTLTYSTHFKQMEQARNELRDLALAFIAGSLRFGSPISDHLNQPVESWTAASAPPETDDSMGTAETEGNKADGLDSQLGFYDNVVIVEQSSADMLEHISAMHDNVKELSERTVRATAEVEREKSVRGKRDVVRQFARDLNSYANGLNENTSSYRSQLLRIEGSLDAVIEFIDATNEDDRKAATELASTLEELVSGIDMALDGTQKLQMAWANTPHVEAQLTRAGTILISALDRTIDTFTRHRNLSQRTIDQIHDKLDSEN